MKCALLLVTLAMLGACAERTAVRDGVIADLAFAQLDGFYTNKPEHGGHSLWAYLVNEDEKVVAPTDGLLVHVYALDDHTLRVRLIDQGRILRGRTITYGRERSALKSWRVDLLPLVCVDVLGYATTRIYLTAADDLIVTENGMVVGNVLCLPIGGQTHSISRYPRRMILSDPGDP